MSFHPTVFDCFCGLGGLSLGARTFGNVVGGLDFETSALEAFGDNFDTAEVIQADLFTEDPIEVLRASGFSRGDVNLLVGGPPCQPYSINNHKRDLGDKRCGLIHAYLKIVSYLRPDHLVLENVPGMAQLSKGSTLHHLLRSLRARGYTSLFRLVDASYFGVPQRRKRLIVVASVNPKALRAVADSLSRVQSREVTVKQAIGDLPLKTGLAHYSSRPKNKYQIEMRRAGKGLSSHIGSGLGEKNLERISYVAQGENWTNIPRHLLPDGMKRARTSDHTTRYGRLRWDRASYTLLTKCDPHWGCFIHPTENRVITVREAARLQSIPDIVRFPNSLTAAYRLIGNSVPPKLASSIIQPLLQG